MKKIASTLCGVMLAGLLALPFVSCTNQDIVSLQNEELHFDIKVQYGETPDTKAVKTAWESGDKIYVFFNVTEQPNINYTTGYLQDYQYMTLTYDGSQWNGALGGTNMNVARLGTRGIMYAVYCPFGGFKTRGNSEGNFVGSSTNSAFNEKPVYSFFLTDESGTSEYQLTKDQFATISGTLTLTLPDNFVYFYIAKEGDKFNENEKYRLSVEGVRPVAVTIWNKPGFSTLKAGAGQPMWGYKYGDGIAFAGMKDDSWNSTANHQFVFFSDGEPALKKTINGELENHASVKLKSPSAGNGWTQAMPTPTYTLMSDGLKWADWNLGCDELESFIYGETFRWGEIIPNGSDSYSNIYNPLLGGNNDLTGDFAIYDAARAYLGSKWRMPTKDELFNLETGFDRTGIVSSGTVSAGHFSDVKGMIFTDKTGDPMKSILLRINGNNDGSYWSSTHQGYSAHAIWVYASGSMGHSGTSGTNRAAANAIRPIYIGE